MKSDDNKKALYESIMTSVAKEVKKVLNENKEDYSIARNIYDMVTKADSDNPMYLDVAIRQGFGNWSTRNLFSKNVYGNDKDSAEILNFSNECFDGGIITSQDANIIRKLTEIEKDENCKGYIVFEEEPYVRGKKTPVYKFVVKLTEVGANLANDITNKRKTRYDDKYNNTDQLEKKLTDLNVSDRMNKFLSKKYGISYFAIEDIKYMCEDFAYMLLSQVKRDNMDNPDFEDDDWDVTKFPKRKGYGPMGYGPMGFGRHGHIDDKKVRDISKRIETTVFEILEDIKKNNK